MWIDHSGAEVLGRAECTRLLALAARARRRGHLTTEGELGPVIEPVDFGVCDGDVVVRAPRELGQLVGGRIVALLVDDAAAPAGEDSGWSVLVRGPAAAEPPGRGPLEPGAGDGLLRIRSDIMSGRRRAGLPDHLRPTLGGVPR